MLKTKRAIVLYREPPTAFRTYPFNVNQFADIEDAIIEGRTLLDKDYQVFVFRVEDAVKL